MGKLCYPNKWIPTLLGKIESNEQTVPLAKHQQHLSVCSGFEVKAPNDDAHTSGPCGFLSGRPLDNSGGSYTFTGPTIDQMIANEIGSDTQFKSVEVAVEPGARGLSFNGRDSRNPPESDPMRLFNRLFGETFRTPGSDPISDPRIAAKCTGRRKATDAPCKTSCSADRRNQTNNDVHSRT